MEFIKRRTNYFMTESGVPWTPIGFNESITWDSLKTDPESYMAILASKGVNCLRLIFEYAETVEGLLETSIGQFNMTNVERWKQIFSLAERYNIRLFMSPYDTFWQWKNWHFHPYNITQGGYLKNASDMLTDPQTIQVHQNRFKFLIENFSGSGALFAWDIWNEIHPAYSNGTDEGMENYVNTISKFIRDYEIELYGKAHLQTCSFHGPELFKFPKLKLTDLIFRNKSLDFASLHIYDDATISDPKNTVEPAIKAGLYIRESLKEIKDGRPFLDGENGPMHAYEQNRIPNEDFDNEYFSNMSWTHICSGGAGAGLRWPYRNPHTLTNGMLDTLGSIAEFSKLVDWNKFNRTNISDVIQYDHQKNVKIVACGSGTKYLVYILRTNPLTAQGMYSTDRKKPTVPVNVKVVIPDVALGVYKIISWKEDERRTSLVTQAAENTPKTNLLTFGAELRRNLILYIEKMG